MLKGAEGANRAFVIEAADGGEPGGSTLGALAWQPEMGDIGRRLAVASDAQFMLDGLAMTSSRNDVGIVAPGLSLRLTGTNAGAPTSITFPSPVATLSTAMQDLVGALNSVSSDLRAATNPLTGDLARDSGARALQRTFAGLGGEVIMPGAPEGAPRTLSDLGLAIERDGSFRLDSARLQATLARDPEAVAAMFTTGLHGVFATFDRIARAASRTGDPGSLAGSIARYQSQSQQVSADAAKLIEQQERLRASLTARFTKADVQIGASKSTLTFLQAQIEAWNSSRK
ncbi:flagellar filament capping protein FliD [Leptolyngbya sp. 15MV]|nr:flagellar filament capping protein FliD [Leptolyngbya sp. 15MV]